MNHTHPSFGPKYAPFEEYLIEKIRKNKTKDLDTLLLRTNAETNEFVKSQEGRYTYTYPTVESYQNSFDDILAFEKEWTKSGKDKDFDVMVLNVKKLDAYMGGLALWRYITKDGTDFTKEFVIMEAGPDNPGSFAPKGRHEKQDGGSMPMVPSGRLRHLVNKVVGKRVCLIDLDYKQEIQDWFVSVTEKLLIIDDHSKEAMTGLKAGKREEWLFSGGKHAACAYAWKFFYPDEPVPLIVQYVDDNDSSLHLPYLPYSNLIVTYLSTYYFHNPYRPVTLNRQVKDGTLEEWYRMFFEEDAVKSMGYFAMMAFPMRWTMELMKQIASNYACPGQLRLPGIPPLRTAMLNFDHETLAKLVGKQMLDDYARAGNPVDVSIVWAYHHNSADKTWHLTLQSDRKGGRRVDWGAIRRGLRDKFPGFTGSGHSFILNVNLPGTIGMKEVFDVFQPGSAGECQAMHTKLRGGPGVSSDENEA